MNSSSRTKKVLAPLAVLLAAGALAVGSGATFTSTTGNTVSSVTAGSFKHTNSKADAAIFGADNMKPGDVVTGEVTIKNTGTLPGAFTLTETDDKNGFGANLQMVIKNTTDDVQVYSGTFGALDSATLGNIAAGQSKTFEWTVTLATSTDNSFQGEAAEAAYTWDAVQLSN